MTAIRATWADFKLVKTRQVAQLIFEIDLSAADNALRALGGVPRPDKEIWVGIAPITEEAAARPLIASGNEDWASPKKQSLGGAARAESLSPERRSEIASNAAKARWEQKPRQRMAELNPTKQAGILCGNSEFIGFLVNKYHMSVKPHETLPEAAAAFVRHWCKVKSRTQLDNEPDRAALFQELRTEFDAWTGKIGRPE